MTINKNLVPAANYALKCPHSMAAEGICVHNTANDASAKNEISYMVGNASQTSFHFAVDDIEVWQGLPVDRNGWHAGDGVNGAGNRKYIGIEICYSKTGGARFNAAEDNAAQLIAQLLKERKWGIEKVKKHQDFSGKYCPARTLDLGWDRFLLKIKTIMGGTMAANYYPTTGDLKIDLNNEASVKAAIDAWVKVAGGQMISAADHNKALEALRVQSEEAIKDKDKTISNLAKQNDTAFKAGFDEGYVKGKSEGVSELPKAKIVIDGMELTLNGVLRKESGKYEASYKVGK